MAQPGRGLDARLQCKRWKSLRMAELPGGSKKILQYLVAPISVNLTFPAALTLDGYSDAFNSPDHSAWVVQGSSDGGDGACAPSGPIPYPVYAVAVPDNPDVANVISGIPTTPTNETVNFTGRRALRPMSTRSRSPQICKPCKVSTKLLRPLFKTRTLSSRDLQPKRICLRRCPSRIR